MTLEKYAASVSPFLKSLGGWYEQRGVAQVRRFLFPKVIFMIDEVSISETKKYLDGQSSKLIVPIQDMHSWKIENYPVVINVDPDNDWRYTRGMVLLDYDKQEGLIKIQKSGDVESRVLELGLVAHKKLLKPSQRLSSEGFDAIFDPKK